MLGLQGCLVLLPFTEPDELARKEIIQPEACTETHAFEPVVVKRFSPLAPEKAFPKDIRMRRLEKLVHQLSSSSDVQRTHAATDIGLMGAYAEPAIPNLSEALLTDESKWVRRTAAKSLAKIGSPRGIPPLKQALNDRDKYVAHSAERALKKLSR